MTALWVLARLRFQDRPDAPATVAPVLAQLRPESNYADLARSVAELRPVITAAVVPSGSTTVLRFRRDAGITLGVRDRAAAMASDRATGLAVVRMAAADTAGVMLVGRVIESLLRRRAEGWALHASSSRLGLAGGAHPTIGWCVVHDATLDFTRVSCAG